MTEMLNINMISVPNSAFLAGNELKSAKSKSRNAMRPRQVSKPLQVEETRYAVAIDWIQLRNSSPEAILSSFVHAIKMCESGQKEEFVVQNIVPNFQVGVDDPLAVLDIHDEIVTKFFEAVAWQGANPPEYRLNLRRGEYDIRFYLGKTKPTDCIQWDDPV